MGFVFQSFNLLPRDTALENVELPLVYAGERASSRRKKAIEALERVGLADRMHHLPNQLSGGQQQRVSIARAIVHEPRMLLADEPTGALDSTTTKQVMELFVELHRQGITVVIVTHDPNIAAYAARVVSFKDGVILSDEKKGLNANDLSGRAAHRSVGDG
jgi:putative ABC transport system ATP-binding protein